MDAFTTAPQTFLQTLAAELRSGGVDTPAARHLIACAREAEERRAADAAEEAERAMRGGKEVRWVAAAMLGGALRGEDGVIDMIALPRRRGSEAEWLDAYA